MPTRVEQPQGSPEKSNLHKYTRVSSGLIAFGSGLAIYGIDKREPFALYAGYGAVASGIILENYISKKATEGVKSKITSLRDLPEANRRESIIKASNDFINDDREKFKLSMGFNFIGGLLAMKGIMDRDLSNFLIGLSMVGYGARRIHSFLEIADKNIDDANTYINRVYSINARRERLDSSRPGRYSNI